VLVLGVHRGLTRGGGANIGRSVTGWRCGSATVAVVRPGRYGNAMSELDELRAEVAHLRDLVGAADLDTMQTRDMLKNQTRLLGALRENQNSMNRVLNEQGQALGGMVLAINGLQQRVSDVDKRVINVEHRVTSMDGRLTGVDTKVTSMDGRLTGVEAKVTSMDENVMAIMRHLGI
jgi:chromosome segregation ATPase